MKRVLSYGGGLDSFAMLCDADTPSQRWRQGRTSFRGPDDRFDPKRHEVVELVGDGSDTLAKDFVTRHHYSHDYVAARFRFGLYRGAELVGAAVFSMPQNPAVLAPFPGSLEEKAELGRFVLLDDVGYNGESWLIARCFEQLRRHGIVSIVSFSDPVPRTTAGGETIFPGHIGTIYQASSAVYTGRSKAETKYLLPDGRAFPRRALSKILRGDRGGGVDGYATKRLVQYGAPPPPGSAAEQTAWARRWFKRLTRPFWHTGNHRYVWAFGRARKHLPLGQSYPKRGP